MKTKVREEYYNNGNLAYRYDITTDGKIYGLYQSFHYDGSIWNNCCFTLGNKIKLENYYYDDIVKIRYYI